MQNGRDLLRETADGSVVCSHCGNALDLTQDADTLLLTALELANMIGPTSAAGMTIESLASYVRELERHWMDDTLQVHRAEQVIKSLLAFVQQLEVQWRDSVHHADDCRHRILGLTAQVAQQQHEIGSDHRHEHRLEVRLHELGVSDLELLALSQERSVGERASAVRQRAQLLRQRSEEARGRLEAVQ